MLHSLKLNVLYQLLTVLELLSGSEIKNKVYFLLNNTLYCIINLKLV